ncbi:hypothetical protein [Kyrpidia sp.]|uniref:hypothetical protein n=1 Tax=Kyrpidia sp. TaxID=2073077 RepID=UPI002585CD03|nr:hypothetical protein [Kyrpidia sp.]MCL6577207.1 hypothetical protein [Kyrpidia sp.]
MSESTLSYPFYYMAPPAPRTDSEFRGDSFEPTADPGYTAFPAAVDPAENRQFPVPGPWIGAGIFLPPIIVPPIATFPFFWI